MTKIRALLDNIAFSHSIFALPFAYIGAILAAGGIPTGHDLFWITLAMVGARSAAMGGILLGYLFVGLGCAEKSRCPEGSGGSGETGGTGGAPPGRTREA